MTIILFGKAAVNKFTSARKSVVKKIKKPKRVKKK